MRISWLVCWAFGGPLKYGVFCNLRTYLFGFQLFFLEGPYAYMFCCDFDWMSLIGLHVFWPLLVSLGAEGRLLSCARMELAWVHRGERQPGELCIQSVWRNIIHKGSISTIVPGDCFPDGTCMYFISMSKFSLHFRQTYSMLLILNDDSGSTVVFPWCYPLWFWWVCPCVCVEVYLLFVTSQ